MEAAPNLAEARREIEVLARTEDRVRVAFTGTVFGVARATDLGWMTPADALVALPVACQTVTSLGGMVGSISIYRKPA